MEELVIDIKKIDNNISRKMTIEKNISPTKGKTSIEKKSYQNYSNLYNQALKLGGSEKKQNPLKSPSKLFDSPVKKQPTQNTSIYNKKIGFDNLGNTCFLNTSLHCLIHSKKFVAEFLLNYPKNSEKVKNTIASEFEDILTTISKMNDYETLQLISFLTGISNKHKKFKGHNQHDSQEFLRILLEDISSDLNRVENIPKYKELVTVNQTKIQLNSNFHTLFLERENSIIVDVFYGQICNTFVCSKCKFKNYSFEKVLDIPILLEETGLFSLSDLLNKYFQDEKLDWESKCEGCKTKGVTHIKTSRISKLPQIMIITFQRYNYRSKRKNGSKISFKKSIDISKFVDPECIDSKQSTKYSLYAISNHIGTLDMGHYFAYCNIDNSWYEFNDSTVANISDIMDESSQVYALFYEQNNVFSH